MISKRNYFAMTAMMLVMLALFMATQIISDDEKSYSRNSYYNENYRQMNTDATSVDSTVLSSFDAEDSLVTVFVGNRKSLAAETVKNWCLYSKGKIYFTESIEELLEEDLSTIRLVVISPDYVSEYQIEKLQEKVTEGADILFYSLPDEKTIEKTEDYQTLLGIQKIVESETALSGIKIFSGFLLGGEVIYGTDEDEEELQDLDLTVPWYQVNYGTKTFVVGLTDEVDESGETYENEDLPPIIWRANHGEGFVYAVNGDYFSGAVGMGVLNGIMTDKQSCYLYPVVNAQVITVADFPGLANENDEQLENIYSRSETKLSRDVLLPGLISFIRRYGVKATMFMMPQSDYSDDNLPNADKLDLYLQQFSQNDSEIGKSMVLYGDTTLLQKTEQDSVFYNEYLGNYSIASIYTDNKELIENNLDEEWAKGVRTVVAANDEKETENGLVVSCLSDTVTEQQIVTYADDFTYSSDLEMRSIQSVLGYSNILFDLGKVYRPESEDDYWENLSEEIFSVADVYFDPFRNFEPTTCSEADERIRTFFDTDYSYDVDGDKIYLTVIADDENGSDDNGGNLTDGSENKTDCWFMLRTHNEKIKKISGGEYTEIESDAYLIHVTEQNAVISLASDDEIRFSMN